MRSVGVRTYTLYLQLSVASGTGNNGAWAICAMLPYVISTVPKGIPNGNTSIEYDIDSLAYGTKIAKEWKRLQ